MSKKKKSQSDSKDVSRPIPNKLQGVNKPNKNNKKFKTKNDKVLKSEGNTFKNKLHAKGNAPSLINKQRSNKNASKHNPNHKPVNNKNKKPFTTVKFPEDRSLEQVKQQTQKKKNKKFLKRLNDNNVNKQFNDKDQVKENVKEKKQNNVVKKNKPQKLIASKAVENENSNKGKPESENKRSNLFNKFNLKKLNHMLNKKEKEVEKLPSKKKVETPLSLRDRMMSQLKASRFRFLNEQMYNNNSVQSKKYFQDDPQAFHAYHEGYKQQVDRWPLNPVDVIIESIKKMPKDHVIADFGCGEAKLADSVSQTVHSFDLVAVNDKVQACDMSQTPLLTGRVNVVVFCLSLMGSNLGDYLLEANRVLVPDGILKIAEVESRFDKIEDFIQTVSKYGFVNVWKDLSHNLFYFMDFKKKKDVLKKDAKKLPPVTLKSCLYKKR